MSQMSITRYKLSVDDYHRMIEAGILTEDDKVELIRGEIIHMSPKGSRHSAYLMHIAEWLYVHLTGLAKIRIQDPIRLVGDSEPEPDIAIVKNRKDTYLGSHPETEDIFLLIEVADSSLETDRTLKASLFAEAGILEYWILNISDQVIEIYQEAQGGRYKRTQIAEKGESIEIPGLKIQLNVGDWLLES